MAKKLVVADNLDDDTADVTVEVKQKLESGNTPTLISLIFYGVDESDPEILHNVVEAVIEDAVSRGLFMAGAAIIGMPIEDVAPETPFYNAVMRNGG